MNLYNDIKEVVNDNVNMLRYSLQQKKQQQAPGSSTTGYPGNLTFAEMVGRSYYTGATPSNSNTG